MDAVVYDAETTGKDAACCQILQFACLRLDRSYVETAGLEIKVKPLPYVVPWPGALKVTGITPESLDDPERMDEFDAAREIQGMLKPREGARRLWISFNGIRYDDEVIRRTLYRNLRYPYFDGITRIDLLPLAKAIWLSGDPGLKFPPPGESDRPSMRLGDLCRANFGEDLEGAHDALVDTRATARLADTIRRNVPWAWDMAFACGSAAEVGRHLSMRGATWLLDTYKWNAEEATTPYAYLGTYQNHALLVDIVSFYMEDIPEKLPDVSTMRYQDSDSGPCPFRLVPLKKSQFFLRPDDVPHYVDDIDIKMMDEVANAFLARKADIQRIRDHVKSNEKLIFASDREMGPSSEEKLYGSPRLSSADLQQRTEFANAKTWKSRVGIEFSDQNLRDFAARILLRNMSFEQIMGFVGQMRAAQMNEVASEALGRPHATRNSGRDKGWATVAECLRDEDCTPEYADWLSRNYPVPEPSEGMEEADEEDAEPAPFGP